MAYEPIHMTWDYDDGPRAGIADFQGQPHYFACAFDSEHPQYAEAFTLTPLDEETFGWAREHWAIWRHWEAEVHAGRQTPESHPKYGHYDPRYNELEALIDGGIDRLAARATLRHGRFRIASVPGELFPGQFRQFEVEWAEMEPAATAPE
ncbi:hypothetical protein [Pseudomonas sp. CGJS7]|uniref:hypothetical protein n=1 Tax=Pseudomonas sp. CGJS7 TaxID=3109348 RepID=UPI00300AF8D3